LQSQKQPCIGGENRRCWLYGKAIVKQQAMVMQQAMGTRYSITPLGHLILHCTTRPNGSGADAMATSPTLLYTVCCSVLQCVAVCCSVLQCVAVCCRVGAMATSSTLSYTNALSLMSTLIGLAVVARHAHRPSTLVTTTPFITLLVNNIQICLLFVLTTKLR